MLACLTGLLTAFEGSAGVVGLVKGHPIQLIISILASLGIGGLFVTFEAGKLLDYLAALVITAPLLPGVAAVITVVIYLVRGPEPAGKYALLWGSAIAVWTWFVLAFFSRKFTDAEHAIPSSWGELQQRMTQLEAGIEVVRKTKESLNDLTRDLCIP